jgi:hypothetical protein
VQSVMRKALYGCIQTCFICCILLTKDLREFGYQHWPIDKCVMRKVKGDSILSL